MNKATTRRALNRLTAREVETLKKPGMHADGGGLYLRVDPSGAKRWVFVFVRADKRREKGLGAAQSLSLAKARLKAAELRTIHQGGGDPNPPALESATPPAAITFGQVADQLLDQVALAWRSPRTRGQWNYSLRTQAAGLWSTPVDEVSTDQLMGLLKPIWMATPESASRLRGRIERVLDAAAVQGHRTGANPARWRGHLSHLLPARSHLDRSHHAAMNYGDLPRFMAALGAREAMAAAALQFAILTASRSGEVFGAVWGEISLLDRLWVIPAHRMKAGREHRVALSFGALDVLGAVSSLRLHDGPEAYVFPGPTRDRPLSNMSMEMLLRRMERRDATVHGFRSSFRDWAGEETDFPREIAEAALAHLVGDRVERAYRRGDALAKRRELMEAWSTYLLPARRRPEGLSTPLGG